MKLKLHFLIGAILLFGILCLAGCEGGSGADHDYMGIWKGTTSHGGTVEMVIGENVVSTLRITDTEANVWTSQLIAIIGNGFTVETSEGVSAPDSPAVIVQCTFDSATHCTGTYSVTRGTRVWTGTFEATKQ